MRERGFEDVDAGHGDGVRAMIMVGKGTNSFQGQPPAIVFLMATVTGMMIRPAGRDWPARSFRREGLLRGRLTRDGAIDQGPEVGPGPEGLESGIRFQLPPVHVAGGDCRRSSTMARSGSALMREGSGLGPKAPKSLAASAQKRS